MEPVDASVAALLGSVAVPGASNTIAVEEVRGWLRELLADYAEERGGAPERLFTEPLWDLMAADADPAEPAQFVAVVFLGSEVQLLAGRGAASRVRAFGDSEYPEDPAETIGALRTLFPTTSLPCRLQRSDVERWLQGAAPP